MVLAIQANRLRILDVLPAVVTSVISALPVFLVAALAFQVRGSLHFGVAALGFVISVYYLSAAACSIPMSRLVEAIGSLRAMKGGCLLMALLILLMATVVRTFTALAVMMAIAGMVSSGLQPATNLFLVRRLPQAHRGIAFGIKQAAVPIALLLAGTSVPTIALTVGWRWAFVTAALLTLVMSVMMPQPRVPFAEYRCRPPIAGLGAKETVNLMFLAFGFSLGVAAASALSAFTVTAIVSTGQGGNAAAGLLASLGGFVAATTRIAVGAHADHSAHGEYPEFCVWAGC